MPSDGPPTEAIPTPVAQYGSKPKWLKATDTAVNLEALIRSKLKVLFSSLFLVPKIESSSIKCTDSLKVPSRNSHPFIDESCEIVVK